MERDRASGDSFGRRIRMVVFAAAGNSAVLACFRLYISAELAILVLYEVKSSTPLVSCRKPHRLLRNQSLSHISGRFHACRSPR